MDHDPAKLALFVRHRAALVDYAARYGGGTAWAEDVVQEAYLRFVACADTDGELPRVARPLGYLYRIVRNLAMDWAHHLYPPRRVLLDDDGDPSQSYHLEGATAPTDSPETDASHHEQLRLLADTLPELPQRTRKAFELRFFGERTLIEIKRELGISVTLAFNLVETARSHCTARLI